MNASIINTTTREQTGILATNKVVDLDPSLERRITMKVPLGIPDEEQREKIWKALVPANVSLCEGVNFKELAKKYIFTGGLIKNALFMAVSNNGKKRDTSHLTLTPNEIEKAEAEPKIDKLIIILIELLYQTQGESHFVEVVGFIENLIGYCIKGGDFYRANSILHPIKTFIEDESNETENRQFLKKIYTTINSAAFFQEIGTVLDSDIIIDNKEFLDFVKHFDKTSIPHLISLLRVLQQMKGRRLLIEVLSIVGRLDIKALGEGINDSKWYVVRNIVIILGNIADSWSKEFLIKALSHVEERVRREVIRALTNIGGSDILPHLKTALNDDIPSLRITSARALGNIRTEPAKKILLDEMLKKDFLKKDFN